MPSGKIKWFNAKKGFGFITPDDKIDEKEDAFIKDYSISSTEITESTDLTGLEFVKH